jgi:hypothetical protein
MTATTTEKGAARVILKQNYAFASASTNKLLAPVILTASYYYNPDKSIYITLNFSEVEKATGYKILRKHGTGIYIEIFRESKDFFEQQYIDDTSLEEFEDDVGDIFSFTYFYRVIAFNDLSESAAAEVSITIRRHIITEPSNEFLTTEDGIRLMEE